MLAEVAIVFRRDVGRDHLPLRRCETVRPAKQNLHQLTQRLCRLGTDKHRPENPRDTFRQFYVSHGTGLLLLNAMKRSPSFPVNLDSTRNPKLPEPSTP